jgi:hypothetical protein
VGLQAASQASLEEARRKARAELDALSAAAASQQGAAEGALKTQMEGALTEQRDRFEQEIKVGWTEWWGEGVIVV